MEKISNPLMSSDYLHEKSEETFFRQLYLQEKSLRKKNVRKGVYGLLAIHFIWWGYFALSTDPLPDTKASPPSGHVPVQVHVISYAPKDYRGEGIIVSTTHSSVRAEVFISEIGDTGIDGKQLAYLYLNPKHLTSLKLADATTTDLKLFPGSADIINRFLPSSPPLKTSGEPHELVID